MTVALTWSAGSVRLTPIAYDLKERDAASALTSSTFPTWSGALAFCDERQIMVLNRSEVEFIVGRHEQQAMLPGMERIS